MFTVNNLVPGITINIKYVIVTITCCMGVFVVILCFFVVVVVVVVVSVN